MSQFTALLRRVLPASTYSLLVRTAKAGQKVLYRKDLNKLARLCGTDKWGSHWYTQHYQRYLAPIRQSKLNLLEIGVGGYSDAMKGGGSLRMWKAFLPNARIVGIDIEDKRHFSEHRIDVRQCDQTDAQALLKLSEEYGGFDVIIDDGSHLNEHVLATFKILFPKLRDGGIYAVEDTQTSYWTTWGGGIGHPQSSMEFFKQMVDGLNYAEYPIEDYEPAYTDLHVTEVSFFHNLIVIRKGKNDEKTNVPGLIEDEMAALVSLSSVANERVVLDERHVLGPINLPCPRA